MATKKYYTQIELDEYVRKLMTDSEIALTRQRERLQKERKENEELARQLDEYKKKEKSISRMLILSERKSKYLETTTRSRCAIEIERLARLSEKWDLFFNDLSNKYDKVDKNKFEEFKLELSNVIDSMLEMESLYGDRPLSEQEEAHVAEISRLKTLKEDKKKNEIDKRFSKLLVDFNMKIGDNASRKRGRPKKSQSVDAEQLISNQTKAKYNSVSESGFDFEEALNPVDSLESILSSLGIDGNND